MQAVMAGHGRRQAGGQTGRYMYTGSVDGGDQECDICKCCSLLSFGLSSCSALCGIMLTVFGSTGFFRTNELNHALFIIGIVLLVAAAVLIALGFAFSRRSEGQPLTFTPARPAGAASAPA